jgi:hypothetical protein
MPRGPQLADSLGSAQGVFASGNSLYVVSPPRYEPTPLLGFAPQDLADAIQKRLLGEAHYRIGDQDVFMKALKLDARQLRLPDVLEQHRTRVRERIAPWIGSVEPRPQYCFKTAQTFVLAAKDSGVAYVEGVYGSVSSYRKIPNYQPNPHAWVTVDGHLVDFLVEVRLAEWPAAPADEMPVYETLQTFSHERLAKVYEKYPHLGFVTTDVSSFALPPGPLTSDEIRNEVVFIVPKAEWVKKMRAKYPNG